MTRIPLSALDGACDEQLDLVRAAWPDGVPLTEEAAEWCVEHHIDLGWAANLLLSLAARADYELVMAPARAEYERAEYGQVRAARNKYMRVRAAALLRMLREAANGTGG